MSMSYFGGTAWHAGIAETAFAAGMLLGGFVLGVWNLKNRIPAVLLSIVVMGGGAHGLRPASARRFCRIRVALLHHGPLCAVLFQHHYSTDAGTDCTGIFRTRFFALH